MADDPMDLLKRRFDFESWASPERRDRNVCVWRFDAAHAPLGKLVLHHASTVVPDTRRQAKDNPGLLRATDSFWTDQERPDVGFHLNTYECESRAAAREQLLRLLGEFQGPIVSRDDSAGEVGFSVTKKTVGICVIGNLVVMLRNGGSKLAAVVPLLRLFDSSINSPAEGSGKKIAMKSRKARLAPGDRSFLDVEPPNGTSIRFIAEGGEVRLEKDQPAFELGSGGSGGIEVIAFRGIEIVGTGSVRIEAK